MKLQKPKWVYMHGQLIPWNEARLHISAEAVTRGLNVFEGLKGYWNEACTSFGLVALEEHYKRLRNSAQLLYIPFSMSLEDFEAACHTLIRALYQPDQDMWLRATLYVTEGYWGLDTKADLVLTAYHQPKEIPQPIDVGISTWQRSGDNSLPPRIKTGANYQVARLARIEGRERGFSEMILLNQWGRVSEATGACLVIVRDGVVIAPPPYEGRLESITLKITRQLCSTLGIQYAERPIERTELAIADELFLVGTLAEFVPIHRLDDCLLPSERPQYTKLSKRFWKAVRQKEAHEAIRLSLIGNA